MIWAIFLLIILTILVIVLVLAFSKVNLAPLFYTAIFMTLLLLVVEIVLLIKNEITWIMTFYLCITFIVATILCLSALKKGNNKIEHRNQVRISALDSDAHAPMITRRAAKTNAHRVPKARHRGRKR